MTVFTENAAAFATTREQYVRATVNDALAHLDYELTTVRMDRAHNGPDPADLEVMIDAVHATAALIVDVAARFGLEAVS